MTLPWLCLWNLTYKTLDVTAAVYVRVTGEKWSHLPVVEPSSTDSNSLYHILLRLINQSNQLSSVLLSRMFNTGDNRMADALVRFTILIIAFQKHHFTLLNIFKYI